MPKKRRDHNSKKRLVLQPKVGAKRMISVHCPWTPSWCPSSWSKAMKNQELHHLWLQQPWLSPLQLVKAKRRPKRARKRNKSEKPPKRWAPSSWLLFSHGYLTVSWFSLSRSSQGSWKRMWSSTPYGSGPTTCATSILPSTQCFMHFVMHLSEEHTSEYSLVDLERNQGNQLIDTIMVSKL